ncbi:MAG: hypothetical protein ACRD51_12150, partial [Candidatus Acidiferrum sp.]
QRIRKTAPGSSQQKEQLAGPQKNVQETAALQIVDILAAQGYVQRSPRAFLDERTQGRELKLDAPDFLCSGIDSLQVFVAQFDEVIQAKILLCQRCHSGLFTKIHSTDSVL